MNVVSFLFLVGIVVFGMTVGRRLKKWIIK